MFALLKNIWTAKIEPGKLYNSLGTEYMLGEQRDYFNFGFWPASNYDEACQKLAFKCADYLNIHESDLVLHAGCGFGQELFDITQRYHNHSIGINLSSFQLNHALNKFKTPQTEFLNASAVSLPFQDNAFDKIIALESAMHFQPREEFMKEAYRGLKPNGVLVCADIILSTQKLSFYWRNWLTLASKIMHVPRENFYDIHTYEKKLSEAGFVEIQHQNLTKPVLWGILRYLKNRQNFRSKNITLAMKLVALLSMRKNSPVAYYLIKGKKGTSL